MLPSSALMLAVPAGIAGCKTIVLATPPRPDGTITPEVLWCAKRAGVTHILKAGGAQAVAAMAWGTESCPKVCTQHVLLVTHPDLCVNNCMHQSKCEGVACVCMCIPGGIACSSHVQCKLKCLVLWCPGSVFIYRHLGFDVAPRTRMFAYKQACH